MKMLKSINDEDSDQGDNNENENKGKKEVKDPFNISSFGIVVTIVYIGIIGWLRWPFSIETLKFIPINELGDFLAGVFGPLTLFWLILGFILQRKEVSQNTETLKLQTEELRNSVKQYKDMVEISRKQAEADLRALEMRKEEIDRELTPNFIINLNQ